MKTLSLRVKLSVSYGLLALLLVASVSLISNLFLRSQFEQYVIRQQDAKNREIVGQITQQMIQNPTGTGRRNALETVGVSALERGVIVKIYDLSGNTIWDATVHNGGFCQQMLKNMAAEMQSRSPNFKGQYEEKTYGLHIGIKKIGTVKIGYYGPFYYTANDAEFINTLNRVLLAVGLGSLFFAAMLGFYMANRISSPISHVIGEAENIAKGSYGNQIPVDTGTKELNQLTVSINRMSGELRDQEDLRKRLTDDVAHELRTPLTALQGNMEALIDGVWKPEKKRFQSCLEEILRLGRLVADLQRLAELENRNLPLNLSSVDLRKAAEKAVGSFQAETMKKRITTVVTGPPVVIQADADKLSRVFVNLLSNAVKYTPEGGRIHIGLSARDGKAFILVEDNGTGMDRKDLPFIFERFYRTDRSRNSRTGGIGIGLTIVKAIVEMHRGKISVWSEPEKGTRFEIVLPMESGSRPAGT